MYTIVLSLIGLNMSLQQFVIAVLHGISQRCFISLGGTSFRVVVFSVVRGCRDIDIDIRTFEHSDAAFVVGRIAEHTSVALNIV